MPNDLERLLNQFKKTVNGGEVLRPLPKFTTYTVTNFRGGIGKSTLSFNLAYEVSRANRTVLLDLCPQRNFTQSLLGEDADRDLPTIYDALLPSVMPGAPTADLEDLTVSVPPSCLPFKGGAGAHLVPGSNELFLFPSLLYTSLNQAATLTAGRRETATSNILHSVDTIVQAIRTQHRASKALIDTSPFFGGATHLGWIAADALVIPVRVDQHSMEALKLTLRMLEEPSMDFLRLAAQAGITKIPKVHAIVLTHCGWNRQMPGTPDRSTQGYITQVIQIAYEHANLFSGSDPIDSIHLLDDFHSAGRISGSKRIPLAELSVGQWFSIDGQRLEVNDSLTRYQREMRALAATL